jgi:hypothetical protein
MTSSRGRRRRRSRSSRPCGGARAASAAASVPCRCSLEIFSFCCNKIFDRESDRIARRDEVDRSAAPVTRDTRFRRPRSPAFKKNVFRARTFRKRLSASSRVARSRLDHSSPARRRAPPATR